MSVPIFDILKSDDVNGPRWVEAAADLEEAKARARRLAAGAPGEYIVFNQETSSVVASVKAGADCAASE
jgi:hypothetical protein